MAKIIDFPKRTDSLDDLIEELEKLRDHGIDSISLVVGVAGGGIRQVLLLNVDAATCAFDALLLQAEAMELAKEP